jgi:UDPglucose--hexose-1-phosphate uridylyltransferase
MSELRKDPVVNRWVIIAPDRAGRPYEFEHPPDRRRDQSCPFCEGHEQETPDEIVAYRDPDSRPNRPGWRVRVVPNKFPALALGDQLERLQDDFYRMMGGVGAHEVIIESPDHLVSLSDLSEERLVEVFSVYRERLAALSQNPRLAHGIIFKNVGAAAGASIEHIHSQLIATPIVPVNVLGEMTGSLDFHDRVGRCVYCEMIQRELASQMRIVADTPGFVAFCPYASRSPFETWILPKNHGSHYENTRPADVGQLAGVIKQVIRKIELALDRSAYNFIIHTAPFDTPELGHYHWYIEIMPSLIKPAGFEWGSGFHINPVAPEDAASVLRSVNGDSPGP